MVKSDFPSPLCVGALRWTRCLLCMKWVSRAGISNFSSLTGSVHYNDVIMDAMASQITGVLIVYSRDAGNGLKDPTVPISTLRRSGHPYPHHRIQWEYNGLRGENRGPFKGQQASASNPVMQAFVKTQIKENINAPRHWPLWGEFPGDRWFPSQRASNAENVSLRWHHNGDVITWPALVPIPRILETCSTPLFRYDICGNSSLAYWGPYSNNIFAFWFKFHWSLSNKAIIGVGGGLVLNRRIDLSCDAICVTRSHS